MYLAFVLSWGALDLCPNFLRAIVVKSDSTKVH